MHSGRKPEDMAGENVAGRNTCQVQLSCTSHVGGQHLWIWDTRVDLTHHLRDSSSRGTRHILLASSTSWVALCSVLSTLPWMRPASPHSAEDPGTLGQAAPQPTRANDS